MAVDPSYASGARCYDCGDKDCTCDQEEEVEHCKNCDGEIDESGGCENVCSECGGCPCECGGCPCPCECDCEEETLKAFNAEQVEMNFDKDVNK